MKRLYFILFLLAGMIHVFSQSADSLLNVYISSRISPAGDGQIWEVSVPGIPPSIYRVPQSSPGPGAVIIDSVPAYSWSFGCSNTSAAMQAGYYDLHNFPDIYLGPVDEGLAPLDNSLWGTVTINGETRDQCPLSATMLGLDDRTERGHVDDFWIVYKNYGPDPYLVNGWNRHPDDECTGDFMGTNQSVLGNQDGSTRFFFTPDGSRLNDYTGNEPMRRDGCHGLRLYYESRGYQLVENFTQLICGMYGNTIGFTFDQFREEIDNKRPVLLQLTGHTMLGLGYEEPGNIVYLHDTWDHSLHSMVWGASYAGMAHWGVTVLRLQAENAPPICNFSVSSQTVCAGQQLQFTNLSAGNPDTWYWEFEGGIPSFSQAPDPLVMYPVEGVYGVKLKTSNEFGYDTETRFSYITVTGPCQCPAYGDSPGIIGLKFADIDLMESSLDISGYTDNTEFETILRQGFQYPLILKIGNSEPEANYAMAWMDWNHDLDFGDAGEEYPLTHAGAGIFSALISVPSDAMQGQSFLRVRAGNLAPPSPCGNESGGEVEDFTILNHGNEPCQILDIQLLLQGLVIPGTALMNKIVLEYDNLFPDDICDVVDIGLAPFSSPGEVVALCRNVPVNSVGVCRAAFPTDFSGEFYIVIRYRNGIETWSSGTVSLNGEPVEYDFTLTVTAAFGNNLCQAGNRFTIYCGDTNQDGIIDQDDMIEVDNGSSSFSTGYVVEDLNGDGLVDSTDMSLLITNTDLFISSISP